MNSLRKIRIQAAIAFLFIFVLVLLLVRVLLSQPELLNQQGGACYEAFFLVLAILLIMSGLSIRLYLWNVQTARDHEERDQKLMGSGRQLGNELSGASQRQEQRGDAIPGMDGQNTVKPRADQKAVEQKIEVTRLLVRGITHEVNNILSGVTGSLYLARESTTHSPEVAERLNTTEQLAFQAAKMIRQLQTAVSEGESEMLPFSLAPFIKEISKQEQAKLPNNIRFQTDICSQDLPIRGDAGQIWKAMTGLLESRGKVLEGNETPCMSLTLEEIRVDEAFPEQHPGIAIGGYGYLVIRDNGTMMEQPSPQSLISQMAVKHHGVIEIRFSPAGENELHLYLPLADST